MTLTPLFFLAGYFLFWVLTFLLIPDKPSRRFWGLRVAVALVAGVALWKLTPLYTHWSVVLDNPLLLVYMNGGLAAVVGGVSAGFTVAAVGLWLVRKSQKFPLWRFCAPVAAGVVLVVALLAAETQWIVAASPAPPDAAQLLVPAVEGPAAAFAEARPQVLVVNFWATWCPPCKAELPDLQDFARLKLSGIQLWGVDLLGSESGGLAAVKKTIASQNMGWKQLVDETGALAQAYNITVIPTTLVFDPKGALVERRVGAVDLAWLRGLAARYGH
jgi:thiol-disulfide isomerase/thioredoxin